MKPSSRLVGNTTICGYQQNLYINETLPGIQISESRNMIVARKISRIIDRKVW
jgi:hypothetical protein